MTRQGFTAFTPAHRGGEGPPLVCLHGFLDSWRTWELVLPALERCHDVFAPTLPGHAGGPAIPGEITDSAVADGVERLMDAAGIETAHLAGNSLGGFVALQLASRGRARSVVALAPAGGWGRGDRARDDVFAFQAGLLDMLRSAAPHADAVVATPAGRRRATEYLTVRHEHLPPDLLAHLTLAGASAPQARAMLEHATRSAWELDAARIDCPVRIVWGTEDRLLPWPSAAARFRREWLPHADWVELDDVGHCPQLDVPLETAQLILGVSAA